MKCLIVVLLTLFCGIGNSSQTDLVTVKIFYSSCIPPLPLPLVPNPLPNLSFGKSEATFTPTWTCSGLSTSAVNVTITWYYYHNLAANADECEHDTATSTIAFGNTVFVNQGDKVIGTATGTVIAGKFLNKMAVSQTTLIGTNLNLDVCNSEIGMEASSGSESLAIALGPTCMGVRTQEFCPGLKN